VTNCSNRYVHADITLLTHTEFYEARHHCRLPRHTTLDVDIIDLKLAIIEPNYQNNTTMHWMFSTVITIFLHSLHEDVSENIHWSYTGCYIVLFRALNNIVSFKCNMILTCKNALMKMMHEKCLVSPLTRTVIHQRIHFQL